MAMQAWCWFSLDCCVASVVAFCVVWNGWVGVVAVAAAVAGNGGTDEDIVVVDKSSWVVGGDDAAGLEDNNDR